MKVLIIIGCIILYFVIGAFCVAKFSEDFLGEPISIEYDAAMCGGLSIIWPVFMLMYLCFKIVILFSRKIENGR